MKNIAVLVVGILIFWSCNSKTGNDQASKIDSLANVILIQQKKIEQLDSITKKAVLDKKSAAEILDIPMFIGKSISQVRDYWSVRVSSDYFSEGIYDDTREKYFSISEVSAGAPLFSASFKGGKCREHQTMLSDNEYSVMIAKLKQAGYIFSDKKDAWIKEGIAHKWRFERYGYNNFLKCTAI